MRHPRHRLGEEALDILDTLAVSGSQTAASVAEDTGRRPVDVARKLWDLRSSGLVERDGHWGGRWHITDAGLARLGKERVA